MTTASRAIWTGIREKEIAVDEEVETVTITLSEYNSLKRDSEMLDALEAGGVDNWEWYGESLSDFFAEEEDDE